MSDDIEVTVTLTPDDVDRLRGLCQTGAATRTERALIAALPDPVPPRSEYPLQHVTESAGCTSVADLGVVLVPAHSLRSGDEVEWAPGDWRAVLSASLTDDDVAAAFDECDEVVHFWPFDLVAVRRSGVTG